jgi:hypothetical protein
MNLNKFNDKPAVIFSKNLISDLAFFLYLIVLFRKKKFVLLPFQNHYNNSNYGERERELCHYGV